MDAQDLILAILAVRAQGATVCPSEAARALAVQDQRAPAEWRDKMQEVHAAVDCLLDQGAISLSWKGISLAKRVGPYRIGRAERG